MRSTRLSLALLLGMLMAVALFVPLVVWAAEEDPRVAIDRAGDLVISSLPPIVDADEVERHLVSGLTTSFVFQVRAPGLPRAGGARVDVRFELWDEVYLVTVIDGRGQVERSRHESDDVFLEWWSEVELVLSPASQAVRPGSQAKVSLAVVPFSQDELVDTQRWLAESMETGGGRGGTGPSAVSALIATSMQRRAVRSMSWSLAVERLDQP